jgi:hypothetical protein
MDNIKIKNRCPRCQTGRLLTWEELDDDQREVVRRLPNSADFKIEDRIKAHRWCARCWYESKETEAMA